MDLIDRYLDAVRLFLPRAQRDDITAELRDVLMNRREEKEAELGRPLTRNEDEALLHDYGHPLIVAARYGRQQYLIGPELYPVYAFVVAIVLASIALAAVITGVVATSVTGDPGHGFGAAMGVIWTGAFTGIGAVTVVFAILQRTGASERVTVDWNVRDLPRIGRRKRETWQEHVAGIVVLGLFVLWWSGLIGTWQPIIPVQPHGSLTLAPAAPWQDVYWPILALALGQIAVHALKLAHQLRLALATDIVLQAAMVLVAGYLLRAGHWVVVTGAGIPTAALAKIEYGVDIGVKVTVIIALCGAVIAIGLDVWRLVRATPSLGSHDAAIRD